MSSSIEFNVLIVLIKFVEYWESKLGFSKLYKGYSDFNFIDEPLTKLDFLT